MISHSKEISFHKRSFKKQERKSKDDKGERKGTFLFHLLGFFCKSKLSVKCKQRRTCKGKLVLITISFKVRSFS